MPTHRELDLRTLELHRLVAAKLRREPALLERAARVLARWRLSVTPGVLPYLNRWDTLIRQGTEPCLRVATEDSEDAAALRQASPLSCLLTPLERADFLKTWKRTHAPAGI